MEPVETRRIDAPSLCVCVALTLAGFATPAAAQETTFHPELFLEQAYNSNLLTQPAGEETGDSITRVGVELPVRRNWQSGSLSFLYQPSYEWYSDNDDLNHDEHRARFGVTAEPARRSTLDYGLMWSQTQSQGTIDDADLGDTVLVPRSERDHVSTRLRFDRDFRQRMAWRAAVEASRNTYTLLEDPGADPTTAGLEDRAQYAGLFGLDRATSRKDRLGVEARWDFYDLESTGDETVAQLSLTWNRAVPESYEASFRIGGFRRENQPGEIGVPLDSDEESGVTFAAGVAKLFPRSRLALLGSHGPSAGGAVVGTSTNTAAALTWAGSPNLRWDWALSSAYTLREPTDPDSPDLETLGGTGRIEWRPGRRAALRLAASYTERATDDPALDATVFVGTLGVVWYPRGPEGPNTGGR